MDTTRRRLASASCCFARSPPLIAFFSSFSVSAGISPPDFSSSASCSFAAAPAPMAWASSTSRSGVSRSTLPISFRYMRTGSSMAKESTRVFGSTISSSGISSSSATGGRISSSSSGGKSSPAVSMPRFSSTSYTLSICSLSRLMESSVSIISPEDSLPFL